MNCCSWGRWERKTGRLRADSWPAAQVSKTLAPVAPTANLSKPASNKRPHLVIRSRAGRTMCTDRTRFVHSCFCVELLDVVLVAERFWKGQTPFFVSNTKQSLFCRLWSQYLRNKGLRADYRNEGINKIRADDGNNRNTSLNAVQMLFSIRFIYVHVLLHFGCPKYPYFT